MKNTILAITALFIFASCSTEDVSPNIDYSGNYTGDYLMEKNDGDNYTFAGSISVEVIDGEFEVENGGVLHTGNFSGDTLFYCQSIGNVYCCGEFIK
jgi:major membrane immunogen (membrane-anchored lipoprotein)